MDATDFINKECHRTVLTRKAMYI